MKDIKETKEVRSIYLGKKTIDIIEAHAKKDERAFSFVASKILDEWASKHKGGK